jgi:hypothetical protein
MSKPSSRLVEVILGRGGCEGGGGRLYRRELDRIRRPLRQVLPEQEVASQNSPYIGNRTHCKSIHLHINLEISRVMQPSGFLDEVKPEVRMYIANVRQ